MSLYYSFPPKLSPSLSRRSSDSSSESSTLESTGTGTFHSSAHRYTCTLKSALKRTLAAAPLRQRTDSLDSECSADSSLSSLTQSSLESDDGEGFHRIVTPPPSPPSSHISRGVRRVELLFHPSRAFPPPRTGPPRIFPKLPPPPELEAIPAFFESSASDLHSTTSESDEDDEISFEADDCDVDGRRRVRFLVPPDAKLDNMDEWTKDDSMCLVDYLLCH